MYNEKFCVSANRQEYIDYIVSCIVKTLKQKKDTLNMVRTGFFKRDAKSQQEDFHEQKEQKTEHCSSAMQLRAL
jgi:hypothetical protein